MPKPRRERIGYTEDDRRYFAGFIEAREKLRPVECSGGIECWVEFGPPCISRQRVVDGRQVGGGIYCLGCGGTPEIAPADMVRGGRYGR